MGTAQVGHERRAHMRVAVNVAVRCRRLGRRLGLRDSEEIVQTLNLSEGGICVEAPDDVGVGDVLMVTLPVRDLPVGLRGFVVEVTEIDGEYHAHVAFDEPSSRTAALVAEVLDTDAGPSAGS
jgi:PilZ domain